MASAIRFKIEGVDDLLKTLKELPTRIERRVLRKAINFATTPVLRKAKSGIPVRTGKLKRAFGRLPAGELPRGLKRLRRKGNVFVVLQPRKGFEDSKGNPIKYAHLVEFGTNDAAAHPFLRPALTSSRFEFIKRLRQKLQEGIAKETNDARGQRKSGGGF